MADPAEVQRLVIERATTEPEFRARLLADPREALSDFFVEPLPEQVRINVIEERPDEATIVLPLASSDVSDAELVAASGFWWSGGTSPGCAPGHMTCGC